MKRLIYIVYIICFTISCFSQKIIFEEEVSDKYFNDDKGPNLKKFSHIHISYGFNLSNSVNSPKINNFQSSAFSVGFKKKYKIVEHSDLGFDILYKNWTFNLKQIDGKNIPNSELHDVEVLSFNNLGIDVFSRINIGKRGNKVGLFIDFGPYFFWTYGAKHIVIDEKDNISTNSKLTKTVNKKLLYPEKYNYGLLIRAGYNRYILYTEYRISNIFKSSYGYEELPRLNICFQLGLY